VAKGSPWLFFLLTFIISWSIWLPGVLDATGLVNMQLSTLTYSLLNLFGGAGPSVAGLLLLYRNQGKEGLKDLLRRAVNAKSIQKSWWIPILLLVPAIQGGALLLSALSGGTVPDAPLLREPWWIPVYVVVAAYLPISPPMREELGWRGCALDRLQSKWNAAVSALILGFFWAMWHLPLYVFPTTQAIYGHIPIWALIVDGIYLSVIMTWIYNNTSRSMVSALIVHAVTDVFNGSVFLYYMSEFGVYYEAILGLIAGILIIAVFGHNKMVRSEK